ncbi:hypothetical protein [Natronobacterium texcoconense]|uniref:Uncharacterized protein n=1 Tax=Natronobacterium texcoconense TaxID=1095778 RepID=A0A1H1B9E3_NATTX|nr:hypothetical protein [Natronobacterium texcoconense]SDQ48585.1 hypothetical protein SAMN04489842_0972 [Natronobacterium texcoconense]
MNRRAFLATLPAVLAGCNAVQRAPDRRPDAPEVKAIASADHDTDVVTFTVEQATGFRPTVVDTVYVESPGEQRHVWIDAGDAEGDESLVDDGDSFAVDAEDAGQYRLTVDYVDGRTISLAQLEVEP